VTRSLTAVSGAGRVDVAEPSGETLEKRLDRLLTAHRAALARLAASYARTTSDRDDLLQEIAIALWRALPAFRGECSERTFLFRIAHNRCMTHLTRRRPAAVPLDETPLELEDPAASSETTLADQQERQRLFRAVRSLPMIYREVVVLMLEGMNYQQIAEVVGISESNVGVRLNRARGMLKELIEVPS
jgi:RNA polymerase sigma factor (sigma-70 family)